MAGYYGISMSNNAIEAYERGLKPSSKWTKKEIIEKLVEASVDERIISTAKKCSVEVLRENILIYSEWHHTSYRYNETGFFCVKTYFKDIEEEVTKLLEAQENFKHKKADALASKKAKELENCVRVKVHYSVSGFRGRVSKYEGTGIVKGDWCYLTNGSKKSISSKRFSILDELEVLPPNFDIKEWLTSVTNDIVCVYPVYK